jgi:hypothetical protein
MSKKVQIKAAVVALFAAAAVVGQPTHAASATPTSIILGLLLFGIVNVLFSTPGTELVRATAMVMTFAGLLSPLLAWAVVIFAALIWPPWLMVTSALARRPAGTPLVGDDGRAAVVGQGGRAAPNGAQVALAALIGAVAVASLYYRWIGRHGLQQTAALFVGIPAILAIVVVFAVSPRSAVGVACKALTVGLLVSLLFLGEGVLCVVMSAPLLFLIVILIAIVPDLANRRREKAATTLFSCFVVLAIVPMSLEGVTDFTTLNREESVSASRVVHHSSQAVERALFESPRFDRVPPLHLRAGFPSPVSTRIERSSAGTRWVIQLRGGEMRLNGMEPRVGDLVLELEEAGPGLLRWRAVSDSSHMTHFLMWRESVVQWEPIDAHTTSVTWTLRYRRSLDPAWYFGPMERYAARLAAGYLIESVATP